MIKVQEAENQITNFAVHDKRPTNSDVLVPAIPIPQGTARPRTRFGHRDAAFYSTAGEKTAHELGVMNISMPNRNTKSAYRRKWEKQKQPWFKQGEKWRTGFVKAGSATRTKPRSEPLPYKGCMGRAG